MCCAMASIMTSRIDLRFKDISPLIWELHHRRCRVGLLSSSSSSSFPSGISDISIEEAFMAWDRLASLDIGVLRAVPLNTEEALSHLALTDIAVWRSTTVVNEDADGQFSSSQNAQLSYPTRGLELEGYLQKELKSTVAATLGIAEAHIDPPIPLPEVVMDLVITMSLGVKVAEKLEG
ncbi:hypothetical protein NUW58_g715 [Xylaria curta]|uniref:Uncharacterized protein n=2 Tax=Xylaria curta TaxID=42375 RepID=A0ACC1PN58_9PEZI|nr:hypothetical protein NUW58_g9071 [Xylaria curta]KAJ2997221.1 hypothetical protein NUW58_g715 [Xylaria curta]